MKFRLIEFAAFKEGVNIWIKSRWDWRFEKVCTPEERAAIDRALDQVCLLAQPVVLRMLGIDPGKVVQRTSGDSVRGGSSV